MNVTPQRIDPSAWAEVLKKPIYLTSLACRVFCRCCQCGQLCSWAVGTSPIRWDKMEPFITCDVCVNQAKKEPLW